MKKSLITIAIAGAIGLVGMNAVADDTAYEGAWYAVPGVSLVHPDNDLDADNYGGGGFLRIGKELSDHWDVQIGGGYTRTNNDLSGVSGKYKQYLIGIDALYMFSRDKFRPFLLAGVGGARNDVDYDAAGTNIGHTTNSWMANVGAGFQYLITDSFGLQADVREVWSRARFDRPSGGADSETINNTQLNLGAIFRFGAPKQVAAVEPEPAPMPVAAAPEPAPEPAPAAVVEPTPAPPAFEKITLDSAVLFGFDKATLRPEGKQKLNTDVVDVLKAHPEVDLVLISGHTDRIGTASYNLDLSQQRANSVKSYLVTQGIEANRLHAVGKGESEPVVDCKGIRGKEAIKCLQPNRRVVVEIEEQR